MKHYLIKFVHSMKRLFINFEKNGGLISASALTYSTLLTLVPLLTLVFVISIQLPGISDLTTKFENLLFKHLIASSSKEINTYLHVFASHASKLSWIGLISLLVTVLTLLLSIESSFNRIWHAPAPKISYFKTLLKHVAFLILINLLIGSSVLVSSYLVSLSLVQQAVDHVGAVGWLLGLIPDSLIFLMIFCLYKYIPTAKILTVPALWGALIAAVILKLSKMLFKVYIHLFPSYKIIYGAFAAIPLFLLWLYIVWIIILFGFQVISHLHSVREANRL